MTTYTHKPYTNYTYSLESFETFKTVTATDSHGNTEVIAYIGAEDGTGLGIVDVDLHPNNLNKYDVLIYLHEEFIQRSMLLSDEWCGNEVTWTLDDYGDELTDIITDALYSANRGCL